MYPAVQSVLNRVCIFFLLLMVIFALPRLLPGDPLDVLLSSDRVRDLSAAELAALRDEMGLSAPLITQFADYLRDLARGDLGYSSHHATQVTTLLANALPWTALLMVAALSVYLVLGVALGLEAGRAPHGRVDRVITTVMTLLASLPAFSIAVLLLMLFAVLLPIFPTSGATSLFAPTAPVARVLDILWHAVLPVTALALHEVVRFYYLSRGEVMSLSVRPFIENARARGVTAWRERVHYFGRNLIPAMLARMSDSVTKLIGGVVYVEAVFAYPGIGHLLLGAIADRDYPLLQGALVTIAAFVLLLNGLIDAWVSALARRG
ncbi:MAG TPA: ABC transporter permease [Gammaproteobacteria bacterium]|jgi:peptide/nickel transport system permease protein|nr:ABC transporter permease [Gammaproteobacteria bacterium]